MEFIGPEEGQFGLFLSSKEMAASVIKEFPRKLDLRFGVIQNQIPVLVSKDQEALIDAAENAREFGDGNHDLVELDTYYEFKVMQHWPAVNREDRSSVQGWLDLYDYIDLKVLYDDILADVKDANGVICKDGIHLDDIPCMHVSDAIRLFFFWKTKKAYQGSIGYPCVIKYVPRPVRIPDIPDAKAVPYEHPWSGAPIELKLRQ